MYQPYKFHKFYDSVFSPLILYQGKTTNYGSIEIRVLFWPAPFSCYFYLWPVLSICVVSQRKGKNTTVSIKVWAESNEINSCLEQIIIQWNRFTFPNTSRVSRLMWINMKSGWITSIVFLNNSKKSRFKYMKLKERLFLLNIYTILITFFASNWFLSDRKKNVSVSFLFCKTKLTSLDMDWHMQKKSFPKLNYETGGLFIPLYTDFNLHLSLYKKK